MGRTVGRAPAGLALAAAVLTTSCGAAATAGTDPVLTSDLGREQVLVQDAAALPEVVAASDRLGLEILAETPVGDNAVASPASAVVALGMLAEGTRGPALDDLDRLLGAEGAGRQDALNALTATLGPLDGDPSVVGADELPDTPVVHMAGQVVVDDGFQVRQPYLDTLATSYGAGVQRTDLASAEGGDLLDAWVAEHTGGLVEASAFEPDPALRLVLQNAVALAARWETPFPAASTSDAPFTLPDGQVVDVRTMDAQLSAATASVSGWEAVRLPYQGGTLHADVLVPPVGTGAHELDPSTLAAVDDALDVARPEGVAVRLPTLDLSTKTDLLPVLGRTAPALARGADLSGISEEPVSLGGAVQQAVLALDEEGTVAGAVTELYLTASGPPRTVAADRPFVLRVGATDTGWTLFLARVDDPRPSPG